MKFEYLGKEYALPAKRKRSSARGWHGLVFLAVWLYGRLNRDWYSGFELAVQCLPCLSGGAVVYSRDGKVAEATFRHECVHVAQMARHGALNFSLRYLCDPMARLEFETEAYAQQYLEGATILGIIDVLHRLYLFPKRVQRVIGLVVMEAYAPDALPGKVTYVA